MAAFYPLFLTLFPYRVQVNYLLFLFRARTFILPPSLLAFVFEAKAWTGRGSGGAIRESTGWDHNFSRRSQKAFRKERRKACGLRLAPWKHHSLVVSRSAALPPCPGGRLELLEPFLFFKK
jgi:hypothetical protein